MPTIACCSAIVQNCGVPLTLEKNLPAGNLIAY